ncbi:16S rRNA (adenine(1518)-N(6)/adenine(1519)-N(6))-dimethyltransferase RsmA [Mycoplasmoides alvi]|uniref:16S rRNA (adenine(1518)-N(6)/adenine(1519)-N(6))- dimethyltransferase RsmA n=1 Tax=Mycoplasmoides alvi TaxID=78580 RepID=UPI000698CF54|nr:16S rRNA (adenine(1518)-N(6)/adenine(1519)-N(6))-dimethyltransferase RsmA [Mycoplasmoides alvi]
MTSKKEILNFFQKNEFIASKKMGQNFLIDQNIIIKIKKLIASFGPDSILEIGPGLGAMTETMKKIVKKEYKAIEIDKRLVDYLITKNILSNSQLICSDALKINWNEIILPGNVCLIGNLPYSISTPLISKFIETDKFKYAIFMLQLEMGQRISAKINSKNYNAFSVYAQYYLDVKNFFIVEPVAFFPQPKVKSCILVLKKNENLKNQFEKIEFKNFLFKCFNQRRKTLFNNLKNYFPISLIQLSFKELNLSLNVRPQELDIQQFAFLTQCMLCKK